MKQNQSEQSAKLVRKNRRKQIWYKILTVLSSVVVFCTTYALILPAITMTEDYYCGIEAHEHSAECYSYNQVKENRCTAQAHQHGDGCYDGAGNLCCGMADFLLHTHSEICYDANGVLVCALPEAAAHRHGPDCYVGDTLYSCGMDEVTPHAHGEECWAGESILVCTEAEREGHLHGETCYGPVDVLVCQTEEGPEHTHAPECYTQETGLICGMEEDAGHQHTEDCWQASEILVCGREEGEVHQHDETCQIVSRPVLACSRQEIIVGSHTAECYDENGVLICGQLTAQEHIHTDECFHVENVTDPVLICEKEVHIHEEACTSDPTADVENAQIWRTTVPDAETLTGDPAQDLIAVAKSQLGYAESTRNFKISDSGDRKGYTRYGAWYGDPYGDWCAMFVSFCLYYGEVPETVIPYESGCARWIRAIQELDAAGGPAIYYPAADYTPAPGDIVFFGSGETNADHVGIVTGVQEQEIKTIEGNTSDSVKERTYQTDDEDILGYFSMASIWERGIALGELEPAVQEEASSEPTGESGTAEKTEHSSTDVELTAQFGDISIRLEAPGDAFPVTADALKLVVGDAAEDVRSGIANMMEDGQPYFAVDIRIFNGEEPIQPSTQVEVMFEMAQNPFMECSGVEIYHVTMDESEGELVLQRMEGGQNGDGSIVLITGHFSTYAVVGTQEEPPVMLMAAGETPTNTWEEALTDRSSYIGVESEGYADSPYTETRQFKGANITALTNSGGTVYVGGNLVIYYDYAFYAETFWDGKKPVRITSDPGHQNDLRKSMYSDWILEDTADPYGALKIDNVNLDLWGLANQKFELYGRGNKIVIGENVNTDDLMGHSPPYIYGGSRTNDSTTSGFPTNVVVTSGRWGLVMGGGGADVNDGTQVTIRDTAEVGIIYGGGIDDGDVNKGSSENATNVYIEGGTVAEVYGGNQTTSRGIKVNGDINIDVSGGQVGTIHAGNDHRGIEGTEELKGSKVRGGAVVNVYNTGSVTNVVGDYMHYDATYGDQLITFQGASGQYTTKGRHIRDLVELNIHSNNEFGYMDYWDIIRINNQDANAAPNSVNVTSLQGVVKIGDTVVNNVGSEYIGRMEVTNGGRFYVKDNCFINFMNEVNTTSEAGVTSFNLNHAWMGEPTQERQAWSTLAVEGSCIEPSTAATDIFTLDNPCDGGYAGLRIKGNVEGFSTLEACGEPMYSTGDTYYYYVVADSSDNGGKAFREPEGAPYVVCYRYLDDGRIGWYLRERPVLTMSNSLVRVGTEGTLTPTDDGFYTGCPENYVIMHVDMKGFAYEWSSTPGKNRVEFEWSIFDGYENATETTGGISLQTMADIENNIYCTSNPDGIFANVEYNAMGSDEGSAEQTKRVSSFYVIIDTSKAVNPRYYEVGTSFHYTRGEDDYDDLRVGQTANAARCTYDFDKEGDINEGLPSDGYANSVMTTYEYKDGMPPKGADDALLRVYLPEGVSANTLTVKELDEQFTFEKTGIAASLVSNSQVAQYYSTEEESTYNHKFGVTLQQEGGSEVNLAGGATLSNLSGKEAYHCAVYSHEKISFTDITPESDLGLQLQLKLNSLTKDGETVGNNDPSAVNDGELRIQVYPVGTIIETTTVTVKKIVEGENPSDTAEFEFLLSYPKINENGQDVTHEERFTLKHEEEKTIIVPLETEITITEITHDGYYVRVENEKGERVENSPSVAVTTPDQEHLTDKELRVTFYNSPGTELPSTGGTGTFLHTLLGLTLLLGAIALFWMHRRGRRAVG